MFVTQHLAFMKLNLKPAVSGDCKYDSLSGPVSLAVRSRIAY